MAGCEDYNGPASAHVFPAPVGECWWPQSPIMRSVCRSGPRKAQQKKDSSVCLLLLHTRLFKDTDGVWTADESKLSLLPIFVCCFLLIKLFGSVRLQI